jgi:hypothetical protein
MPAQLLVGPELLEWSRCSLTQERLTTFDLEEFYVVNE